MILAQLNLLRLYINRNYSQQKSIGVYPYAQTKRDRETTQRAKTKTVSKKISSISLNLLFYCMFFTSLIEARHPSPTSSSIRNTKFYFTHVNQPSYLDQVQKLQSGMYAFYIFTELYLYHFSEEKNKNF